MTRFCKWGPVFAWMALIFFVSSQSQLPALEQRWVDAVLEKSAHFFEFVVLAILLFRAFEPAEHGRRRALIATVLVAWMFALSDEFHQMFVPGRQADWLDILFDWAGGFVGVSVGLYWWTVRRNRIFVKDVESPPVG